MVSAALRLLFWLSLCAVACNVVSATFVKTTLISHQAPPDWEVRRGNIALDPKRLYQDPIGPAGSIYSTLLPVGGRVYRLIMENGAGCAFSTNFYELSGNAMAYTSIYDCKTSITFQGVTDRCGLGSTYADGTFVTAVAATDTVTVGPWTGDVVIGNAYQTSDTFVLAGSDGIWGLGRPAAGLVGVPKGPLKGLSDAGMPHIFAICLTINGGELHLGGFDPHYANDGAISWIPWVTSDYHYSINVNSIRVGPSTTITGGNIKTITDTGSTISYFTPSAYNQILTAIETACPACDTTVLTSPSLKLINTNPADWPTIYISFLDHSGAEVVTAFTGAHYLVPYGPSSYYGGFRSSGTSSMQLFGSSFLRRWYSVYDVTANKLGLGIVNGTECQGSLPTTPSLYEVTPSTALPPNPDNLIQPVEVSPWDNPPKVDIPEAPEAPGGGPSLGPPPPGEGSEPPSYSFEPDAPTGTAASTTSMTYMLILCILSIGILTLLF